MPLAELDSHVVTIPPDLKAGYTVQLVQSSGV